MNPKEVFSQDEPVAGRWFPRRLSGRVVLAAAGVSAVLGAGALGFVYFGLMGGTAPARLALSAATPTPSGTTSAPASASPAAGSGSGTWKVASGSVAGYRVHEQLGFAPAPSDAVGRTSAVTGSITINQSGTVYSVTAGSFSVDVSTLTSDRAMRDQRIHTMGLESDRYPTATFNVTSPIALPSSGTNGQAFRVQAVGDLTIHGTTRSVTIPMDARLNGTRIEVAGAITFPFSEFGMTPPSIGGFVTVQNNATMEFDIVFQQ
jgi:polyisoprenoid-binding protein YceI